MFLPMSCTSPLTVAVTSVPCARSAEGPSASFSSSMKGSRWATAFFIARADFTTWGRNIFPAPNRSPTICMPAISGPSITSSGRSYACRASSVSSTMKSTMPCTRAWESRSSTEPSRQVRSSSRSRPPPFTVSANVTMRSVASVAAVEDDVLDVLEQILRDVLVHLELAGVHDRHVEPGRDRVVEERGVDRAAHRLVPAEREAQVRHAAGDPHVRMRALDLARGLDERLRVLGVLLEAGRDREDVGVDDDVGRLVPGLVDEQPDRRDRRSRPCARPCRPGRARRSTSRRRRRRTS